MLEDDIKGDERGLDHQVTEKPKNTKGDQRFLFCQKNGQPDESRNDDKGEECGDRIEHGMGNGIITVQIQS